VNEVTNFVYQPQSPGQEVLLMHSYEVEVYIDNYTLKQNYQSPLPGYCFDDLGAERQIKYFGNECNVIAEIILSRYDIYTVKNIQTHITTNLSASEIENAYSNRIRSRFCKMLNLIAFDKNTLDKR
jgi:hypothetical protein